MPDIYTIGYASKPVELFVSQLKQYSIDVVVDIRSVPYSKVFHDYHQEAIKQHLHSNQIRYLYLGEELGPRSKDDTHYDDAGQVQFDRLMGSVLFLQGVERLKAGFDKGFNIALMCAEKDAATCHRSLLVGHFLIRNKAHDISNILHITHDGDIETQAQLEQRLLELHELGDDLFMSKEESMKQAYQQQLVNTSYRKPEAN